LELEWHVASPLYLQTHPTPQSPADLAGHNCLRHASNIPAPDEWPFEDPAGNLSVARVTASLITTSIETMNAAAAAGVGLVLTGPFLVADFHHVRLTSCAARRSGCARAHAVNVHFASIHSARTRPPFGRGAAAPQQVTQCIESPRSCAVRPQAASTLRFNTRRSFDGGEV